MAYGDRATYIDVDADIEAVVALIKSLGGGWQASNNGSDEP